MPLVGLVIPCYREGKRLPRFLPALLDCLAAAPDFQAAVLIVDDGSGDEDTALVNHLVGEESARHPGLLLRPIGWRENRGKGAAVHAGWDMLAETCAWLAFVDADGAVPAEETCRLLGEAVRHAPDTAVFGERTEARVVERNAWRQSVGWAFRLMVRLLVHLPLRDTQCGIKIVPTTVYRAIRPCLARKDFAFDIELAMAVLDHGYHIAPVPVRWKEQPGSHVKPRHVLAMATAVAGFGLARLTRGRMRC